MTLAVVEPSGSGLGGGGFWLLKRAKDGKEIIVDGREKAPLAAHEDMYLDAQGNPITQLSLDGARAAGIRSVWMNRTGGLWPAELVPADHEVTTLSAVVELVDRLGVEPAE